MTIIIGITYFRRYFLPPFIGKELRDLSIPYFTMSKYKVHQFSCGYGSIHAFQLAPPLDTMYYPMAGSTP